jgi:hypothetical protein
MDNRQEINLIGGGFQHSPSTSGYEPLYMKWVKGNHTAPISIHVDHSIMLIPNETTKNYGSLSESKDVHGSLYLWCTENIKFLEKNYIKVFTHDVSLLPLSKVFVLQVSGKSFIAESDGKIYPKSKLVSMIASNKKMCPAHLYRQEIIRKFSHQCDHFGRGFREITNKIDGLKDYCFSITMENGTYPNMVSEKITDCFMTGTIPIFYGIDNIGEFFNTDGIITLDDNFKIEDLSFELYESKLEAIKENFEISMNMLVSEDYLYLKYIKNEI